MVRYLLTLIVFLGTYTPLWAVTSSPYSHFVIKDTRIRLTPRRGAGPVSCRSLFSPHSSQLFEFTSRHHSSDHITVADGAYRPQYSNTAVIRVSRFFKVRMPGYAGYWMWEPGVYRGDPGVLGTKMVESNNHFFRRWKEDFGYNPSKVDELNAIANRTSPLRKTHIGYRMGETPWAEVTLFDAAKTLRVFTSEGKLEVIKDTDSKLSEIEVRFPELKLPERVRQDNGENAPFFVISKLTSLPEISQAIKAIYHTTAQHLLLRLNPDLIEASHDLANIKEKQEQMEVPKVIDTVGVAGATGRPWSHVPSIVSPLRVSIAPDNLPKAFFNAEKVMIYGVATTSMAKKHSEFGWQVNQQLSRQLSEPDMVVIQFPVGEFIARYLDLEKFTENLPKVSEPGKDSKEYREEAKREHEAMQEVMERFRRLQQTRRSLH